MRSWGRRGSVTLQFIPVLRLLSPVVSHTTRLVWPFQGARAFESNVQKILLSFKMSLENASQLPARITKSILESSSKVITYLFLLISDYDTRSIKIHLSAFEFSRKFAMPCGTLHHRHNYLLYYRWDMHLRYIKKRERACIQCWTAIFAESIKNMKVFGAVYRIMWAQL